MSRGYEDAYHQFIEPVVGASGERKVLFVNKRDREFEVQLPESTGAKIEVIDQTTGSNPPASSTLDGSSFKLGGFAVAVVTLTH